MHFNTAAEDLEGRGAATEHVHSEPRSSAHGVLILGGGFGGARRQGSSPGSSDSYLS